MSLALELANEPAKVTLNRIASRPFAGRVRLVARWGHFAASSLISRDFDFVRNAIAAQARLAALTLGDVFVPRQRVECSICGWKGRSFYPNTGPGYHEMLTLCPSCRVLDRHRSLVEVLRQFTDFFDGEHRVIEVAPMRGFEEMCLAQSRLRYTSFDLERHAMERGDITRLRYADDSAHYFICFHVLEHITEESKALSEIRRVLQPGGCAVLQVPIDWRVEGTYEYARPDPREVGHVRRYGRDFAQRLATHGFSVKPVSVSEFMSDAEIARFGLSRDPIFLALKANHTKTDA